jgi:hypothetical protein
MMTEQEIVRETAAFYNSKNRGTSEKDYGNGYMASTCQYLTADNKKCAVGRCMTTKGLETVLRDFSDKGVCSLQDNIEGGLDNVLKKKYRGHHYTFWGRLQNLHDNRLSWDENGITEVGESFVRANFGFSL